MNWFTQTMRSTLGRKLVMAVTGLFLVLFLTGHAAGNLLLFENDGGQAFNEYARFMVTYPVVKVLSYLTYISILFHVIYSIILTNHNRKARPISYAVNKGSENSKWTSRNMGILGTFILIFLVIHLKSFWYEMRFGEIPLDQWGLTDLYSVVVVAFQQWWYCLFYVICMVALGYHLSHGFISGFQTLGLDHKKYTPVVKFIGLAYSITIAAIFASMPIYFFIKSLG